MNSAIRWFSGRTCGRQFAGDAFSQTIWISPGRVSFTLNEAKTRSKCVRDRVVTGIELPIINGWHKAQVRACKINARTHHLTEEHTAVFNLRVLPHILVKLVLSRLHQLS